MWVGTYLHFAYFILIIIGLSATCTIYFVRLRLGSWIVRNKQIKYRKERSIIDGIFTLQLIIYLTYYVSASSPFTFTSLAILPKTKMFIFRIFHLYLSITVVLPESLFSNELLMYLVFILSEYYFI